MAPACPSLARWPVVMLTTAGPTPSTTETTAREYASRTSMSSTGTGLHLHSVRCRRDAGERNAGDAARKSLNVDASRGTFRDRRGPPPPRPPPPHQKKRNKKKNGGGDAPRG